MRVTTTPFRDLVILEPRVFEDNRGYFFESYNEQTFRNLGLNYRFVQDNQSYSTKGVLRGLHFQIPPYAQTKLVRVLSGTIQDVVVDLRKSESTFGKYFSIELSAENRKQLLVPKGFAHGFLALTTHVDILYRCDEFYNPECERGIIFNDPDVGVKWKMDKEKLILSDRDKKHQGFEYANFFD